MPRKNVPKTKKFRKRTRKVFRKRRHVLSFTKAPMPNRFASKLRYVSYANLDPGLAGIAGVQIVNAMGCYDPDITGVGHQPRGFDQLMTMYDHYTVIGSRITVEFVQKLAGSYNAMSIGIACKDDSVALTDVNDYLEGRNVVSTVLPPSASAEPSRIRVLSKSFSTKKFMGISHPMSSSNCRGSATTNPADSGYFHIFAAPLNTTSDQAAITVQYRIDFLVIFTEPKQPAQS